jgi:CheY-like chemotaxis protein
MAKTILVVDDELDAREIVAKRLRQNGYIVRTAATGREALAQCRAAKPELVLLDIAIPDMDGYEVAEAVGDDKSLAGMAVIFITGKDLSLQAIEERIARLGPYQYLTKPCSFEDILAKVTSMIGA